MNIKVIHGTATTIAQALEHPMIDAIHYLLAMVHISEEARQTFNKYNITYVKLFQTTKHYGINYGDVKKDPLGVMPRTMALKNSIDYYRHKYGTDMDNDVKMIISIIRNSSRVCNIIGELYNYNNILYDLEYNMKPKNKIFIEE